MRACECRAIGCRALILPTQVMCNRCLHMVESDVRRMLEKTFRPGQPASQRFNQALAHAQREIVYYKTQGHHVPRDRPFEWDEDETRF